jgi:hypothetical protein
MEKQAHGRQAIPCAQPRWRTKGFYTLGILREIEALIDAASMSASP